MVKKKFIAIYIKAYHWYDVYCISKVSFYTKNIEFVYFKGYNRPHIRVVLFKTRQDSENNSIHKISKKALFSAFVNSFFE